MFSLSHSLTFMVLNQLQPSTMPETHSHSYPRDTSWPKSAKGRIENLVVNVKRVAKAAAPEEGSTGLISISGIILGILGSGIVVGSTGSPLFPASSIRSHKAMYISFYTVYALDFILPIISILLCVIKPYCHRPRVQLAAGYLVGGSAILLGVVFSLGGYAHFISSDKTSSPPQPPPSSVEANPWLIKD